MIDAGRLDQRVEVRAATTTKNALGEEVAGFALLRRVWARVVEDRGREFVGGADVRAQRKVAFQLRWASDIDRDCRVLWQGWTFEIVDMTGTRQSGELWLHCMSLKDDTP